MWRNERVGASHHDHLAAWFQRGGTIGDVVPTGEIGSRRPRSRATVVNRRMSCAARVRETVQAWPVEHFVFSFHSLPVSHLKKLDAREAHCLVKSDCCDAISAVNQNCYRAQCIFTARAIARELGLKDDGYTISFQSRLGRAEWLGPQTEDVLKKLAHAGVKRVAVACPSFVADCLETLEEIGIRAHHNFIQTGGEELRLVPSLNSEPAWVEAVVGWIRELCV